MIGNKIFDKITRASKTSPKINSETNREEVFGDAKSQPSKFRKKIKLK